MEESHADISPEAQANRDEWITLVTQLIDQIQTWSEANGWSVIRGTSQRSERLLGTYEVPTLEVHVGPRRLYVEPVARYVFGADGRVDILSSPSLNHVVLARQGDQWKLYDQQRTPLDVPWDATHFTSLSKDLAEAA